MMNPLIAGDGQAFCLVSTSYFKNSLIREVGTLGNNLKERANERRIVILSVRKLLEIN